MSDPWFKFFPEKWQGGVARLRPIERSIYIDLLAEMYVQDGPIKRDDKRLARLCGTTPKPFTAALIALIDCRKIEENNGQLSNPAAQKLIDERKRKRKARSEAAKNNSSADENIISEESEFPQQNQCADLANADTERERDRELELSASSSSASGKIELVRKLEAVTGNAMDWQAQAVAYPAVVVGWMSGANAADLELDILPTIKSVSDRRQARGDPRLNNWAYFRKPVFKARDERLNPAANPAPQTPKARHDRPNANKSRNEQKTNSLIQSAIRASAGVGSNPNNEVPQEWTGSSASRLEGPSR